MTVKLPQKAGFAPTVAEWDALVRIAENLAAQLAQAQAERDAAKEWRDTFKSDLEAERASLKSALISAKSISDERYNAIHKYHDAVAERDAARAEVARLRAALDNVWRVCSDNTPYDGASEQELEIVEICRAALRGQPAPAGGEARE